MAAELGREVPYRPHQEEAIRAIVGAYERGIPNVVLDAEVGAGKSVVLVDALRILEQRHKVRAYYTSPRVALVRQLDTDALTAPHVQTVFGRSNYPCPRADDEGETTAAEGDCVTGPPCGRCRASGYVTPDPLLGLRSKCPACKGRGVLDLKKWKCPQAKECPYFVHRGAALRGPRATMTADYLTMVTAGGLSGEDTRERFGPRDILVVDEADELGDYGVNHMALGLYEGLRSEAPWVEWFRENVPQVLELEEEALDVFSVEATVNLLTGARGALVDVLHSLVRGALREGETRRQRWRKVSVVENLSVRFKGAVEDLSAGGKWVIERAIEKGAPRLLVTPVTSHLFLRRRWWPLAPFRVFSSGTFIDPEFFLSEVGLSGEPYEHVRVPPAFPAERGPVIDASVGYITQKTREEVWPLALRRVSELLDRERGRGLIHLHSYLNLRSLQEHLASTVHARRIVYHGQGDRNQVLNDWLANGKEDSVLASVNMNRGLDLKDDLARFQISMKCPWPSLGSRRIRRRMALPDGALWYEYQALRSEVQSWGRIVRSPNDFGSTYLVDRSAVRLVRKHFHHLPAGAQARVSAGSRGPVPEARVEPKERPAEEER